MGSLLCLFCALAPTTALRTGAGIFDITGLPNHVNFMGMANPSQKGTGVHFRLRARAFAFADDSDSRVAFVSLDAGMPGVVLKNRVIAQLAEALGPGVCMHHGVLNLRDSQNAYHPLIACSIPAVYRHAR